MWQSDLVLRATEPGLAKLDAPLVWDDRATVTNGKGFGRVEFPVHAVTDLGSTPQPLRFIRAFDPWRTGRRSAVGHDYLYRNGKWPDGRPVTRAEADRFLREGIKAEGHWSLTAASWWFGVRSCGWLPWNEYREAERDNAEHT
jgi:hypothetical protein